MNLKSAIAARRWRQVDFATSLKISSSVLSEIIHERRRASAELRARVAEALQADESWLFSCVVRIPSPTRSPRNITPPDVMGAVGAGTK